MTDDLVQLANEATPYLTAAASAYGGAVLAHVQDDAATATVGVGRRILHRVFGVRPNGEEPPEELADVIADPDDPDNVAALRKALRKALAGDAELAAEVRRIVNDGPTTEVHVTASGERSVSVQTNSGIIVTGDHGSATVTRDV